jgi:hypothetical protein
MLRTTGVHHITSTTEGKVSGMYVRIPTAGVVWAGTVRALKLAARNRTRSRYGRVRWDQDSRVCKGYNVDLPTVSFSSPASHNELQPLPRYFLPHFFSRTAREPGLKTLPASLGTDSGKCEETCPDIHKLVRNSNLIPEECRSTKLFRAGSESACYFC